LSIAVPKIWVALAATVLPIQLSLACSAGGEAPFDAPPGSVAMGDCAPDNATARCSCGTAPGRQVCTAGVWGTCECATPGVTPPPAGTGGASGNQPQTFPGNNRTDITFSWQSTAPAATDGTCPPGRYEGNIQGIYYSAIFPVAGVPIANFDLPGQPSGFYFDLAPAQGGETLQRVTGEVNGTVDLAIPFKTKVVGELNCRSGVFTGKLTEGTYSILIDNLLEQTFEGVAGAKYDKRTHTFINGTWDVRETSSNPQGTLAPTLPRDLTRDGLGGSGDFAAALPTDLNDPTLLPGPLGPNKNLCNTILGTPICATDAECTPQFPGETVMCLDASLFSLCLRECKK
jgi:hypothetical protein